MKAAPAADRADGFVRTVLADRTDRDFGVVYTPEHLIIDSPYIAAVFPDIHLYDVGAAVEEMKECRAAGVGLVLDAMPCASGRAVDRLALISERSNVDVIAATGLHHDRYYGPDHWSGRVGIQALVELFVADLTRGIDLYDCTGPLVQRTAHRAGVIKVATSGVSPDARDLRNLEAAARASVLTGAPILTHCEKGTGAMSQVERLCEWGVPPSTVILSHVDKTKDLHYLRDIAQTGAILEFDQALRSARDGAHGFTATAVVSLTGQGFGSQIVVGTDGARRTLWRSLGCQPGLAWLAAEFPKILRSAGLEQHDIQRVMKQNAATALAWRQLAGT
jgi:predicted metal-dependent phosphotriesterase family hydrolase